MSNANASSAPLRKPLAPNQSDVWLQQIARPQSAQFNISPYYPIPLALDADRFLAAVNWVFAHTDALYARLVPGAGDVPELLFDPANAPRCEFIDLSGETNPEKTLADLLDRRTRTPFRMMNECLARPALIKTGERAFCYVCEYFHLAVDAWASAIVFQRIVRAYDALRAGAQPQIEGGSYADHLEACRTPLAESALTKALDFWKPLLAHPMPTLPQTHALAAGEDDLATACVRVALPRALGERVTAQAASCNATLFHAVILAFNHLLAKQYGLESPPVSLPMLNRSKAHKETVGFFAELRALPMPLDENASVADNLHAIARRVRELFRHYHVPASTLTQLYHAAGHSGTPGGLSAISYVTRDYEATIDGHSIPMINRTPSHQTVPFVIYFLDIYPGQDPTVELVYLKRHANQAEAELLMQRLLHLLDGIAQDLQRPLGELDLLPPSERRLLASLLRRENEYVAAPRLVIEDILARARCSPEAIAVESGSMRCTYRECLDQAHAIAHVLVDRHGVRPGDRVALLLPRGPEFVSSFLAVMLAGATTVPVDPRVPELRARQICDDAQVRCLITAATLGAQARRIHDIILHADDALPYAGDFTSRAEPDQIAYIIYTSGSTGKPKGVEIPQRSFADHCASWLRTVPLREGSERMLHFFSPAFDATIEIVFPTLLMGGTLVTAPHPQWTVYEFARVVVERRLTFLYLPPAYLLEFLKLMHDQPGQLAGHQVRFGLAAGDVMHAETALLWDAVFGHNVTLFNGYGPTEITVTATVFQMPPGYRAEPGESLPIGRPHAGRALRIVDPRGRDVPLGAEGELLIGGHSLGRGYHGMPEETAARFVTLEDGQRYYRSGDGVRLRTDGQIVFRRRLDRQVKIRGFRIELGEIESCLLKHPAVRECAVVVHAGVDGHTDELRGFVSLAPGNTADAHTLREFLLTRLPDYMVPTIAVLDRLPKNSSDKIDRKALLALPAATEMVRPAGSVVCAPKGAVQEYLATLWSQSLGTRIADAQGDFFEQGGHSLLAAKLTANIGRAFRVDYPISAFFAKPTIADTARELERLVGDKARLEKMASVRLELAGLTPEQIQARLQQTRQPVR